MANDETPEPERSAADGTPRPEGDAAPESKPGGEVARRPRTEAPVRRPQAGAPARRELPDDGAAPVRRELPEAEVAGRAADRPERRPADRRPMPPESRLRPDAGAGHAGRDGEAGPRDPADGSAASGGASGGGSSAGGRPDGAVEGGDGGEPPMTGRQRLRAGLWPPRLTRAQLIVAVLLFILGLGLAIQVRSTSDSSALRGARQEDLVRILDELDNRSQRLTDEQRRLEGQKTELENSSDQAEEARKQTVEKEQQLGVLAGTVAAQGPGINLTINDPTHSVEADKLLDTIQELRAAGAGRFRWTTSVLLRTVTSRMSAAEWRSTARGSRSRTVSRSSGSRRIWSRRSTSPVVWCRLWKRSRPRWVSRVSRRSSWTPCERRSGLTTLGRHRSERDAYGDGPGRA